MTCLYNVNKQQTKKAWFHFFPLQGRWLEKVFIISCKCESHVLLCSPLNPFLNKQTIVQLNCVSFYYTTHFFFGSLVHPDWGGVEKFNCWNIQVLINLFTQFKIHKYSGNTNEEEIIIIRPSQAGRFPSFHQIQHSVVIGWW